MWTHRTIPVSTAAIGASPSRQTILRSATLSAVEGWGVSDLGFRVRTCRGSSL